MKTPKNVVSRETVPQQIAVEMVRRIATEITFHPQDLKVYSKTMGMSWLVVVEAHRGDVPRLIGGGGLTFKALDAICAMIGNKHRMNIRFRIDEERSVGEKDRYERFKAAADWNKEGIMKLLEDLCRQTFDEPVEITVQDEDAKNSIIAVHVSPKEMPKVVEAAKKAYQIVFNAVGKANGRLIALDLAVEGTETTRDLGAIFS